MKSAIVPGLLGTLIVAGAGLAVPPTAQAGVDACGNIRVEADAECEVRVEGGMCKTQCEPIRFRAACAGELYAKCDGECSGSASVDCTASCTTDCMASCEVEPGSFECRGHCSAMAEAYCEGECRSMADGEQAQSECEASCEATVSGECEASCEAEPPDASCQAKCEASCEGQCTAEAELDCHVDCQADGYVDCYAELEGGCETQCEKPEGALFCEGNYVDHGDNLQMCIQALKEQYDIETDTSATGMAGCDGGTCSAEGEAMASASCSVGTPMGGQPAPWLLGAGALVGLAWLRRRG